MCVCVYMWYSSFLLGRFVLNRNATALDLCTILQLVFIFWIWFSELDVGVCLWRFQNARGITKNNKINNKKKKEREIKKIISKSCK